jgi:hypothetical protein
MRSFYETGAHARTGCVRAWRGAVGVGAWENAPLLNSIYLVGWK